MNDLRNHIINATPKTPRRVRAATVLLWVAAAFVWGAVAGRASAAEALFEATSQAGETKAAFLHRVGALMRQWSDGSTLEACGVIATDGERFGVVVKTSGSHLACASGSKAVPAGMQSTGETIHTHGTDRPFVVNDADAEFTGLRKGSPIHGQRLDRFSRADYAEPGYLAAPGGELFYQEGKGTQRAVAL